MRPPVRLGRYKDTVKRTLKFNLMAHPFWHAYLEHMLQSRLVTSGRYPIDGL